MTAAFERDLPEGLVLGERVGKGGMGEVFAAQHPVHGAVVVKLLHAHLDPRQRDRMRLEGEALARIRSPHVVTIHDWGLAAGRPFLVMERLEGQELEELIEERGALPVGRALRIARDVALGLSVVHQHKLVHRDIKPSNIFVADDGRAVLLDFGVVKLLEQLTGVSPLANPTQAGAAVGTPRYMSPEQATSRSIDGRADLYALGAVLFRMLTGEHLFDRSSLVEMLRAHLREPPRRPSELARQPLPAGLDELVLFALAKRPSQRPASAMAMVEALEALDPDLRASRPEASPVAASAAAATARGTQFLLLDELDTAETAPGRGEAGTQRMRAPGTLPMPAVDDSSAPTHRLAPVAGVAAPTSGGSPGAASATSASAAPALAAPALAPTMMATMDEAPPITATAAMEGPPPGVLGPAPQASPRPRAQGPSWRVWGPLALAATVIFLGAMLVAERWLF